MLALRSVACSGRWDTAWPAMCQELRDQQTKKRQRRVAERRARREEAHQEAVAEVHAQSLPSPREPTPKAVVDGQPTSDHPWTKGYDQELIARARAKS